MIRFHALVVLALLALAGMTLLHSQTTPAAAPASAPAAPAAPGAAPANATQSEAAARSQREQTQVGQKFSSGWGEKLHQGGNTAIVQLLVSIFGAAFVFERFFNMRRSKIAPKGLANRARELWKRGDFAALERIDEEKPGSTLARAISWVARHRHASFGDISTAVGDMVSQELEVNHQRAYPLGVIAQLEPLLGLLGMILGMTETFQMVALAGGLGDPGKLAGGISEALVTTGLGLAIAIPFLALFHYFKSQTNMYGLVLEREITGLLNEWFLSRDAVPHEGLDLAARPLTAPAKLQEAPSAS